MSKIHLVWHIALNFVNIVVHFSVKNWKNNFCENSKVYPRNRNLKELTFCKSRYHFIMWSRISSIFHDYALLHSLFTFAFIIYKNYSLSNTSQYHISIFIWKYIAVVWSLLIIRKPFTSKKWEHNKSLMIINFILRFIGKIPLLEHNSNVEKKQNGWIHLSPPHLKNTSTKLHPTASFQNTSYEIYPLRDMSFQKFEQDSGSCLKLQNPHCKNFR